ncbi:MAG: hypothetical protein QF718_09145 [Phycisphaerales bacterium]|jgi:hypothetical protein|nr:hypothetical protein [Phycisphaerales bacterium]
MSNETHNYKQLIELAVLDAYGLLEPIESDLFNRSFHDAPATIQDEIIRMQRDFAVDESLLPADLPPASLKQLVLDSVAKAADKEAQRLAPLALIGARASAAKSQQGTSTTTYFWRTAALILFGISVVLGIIVVDTKREVKTITNIALNNSATTTVVDIAGKEFKSFIDNPYCQVLHFIEDTQETKPSYLRVAMNERFGGGFILGLDLKTDSEFIVQGTTKDGTIIELARFTANGPIVGRPFDIDKDLVAGLSVAVIDAKTGELWS